MHLNVFLLFLNLILLNSHSVVLILDVLLNELLAKSIVFSAKLAVLQLKPVDGVEVPSLLVRMDFECLESLLPSDLLSLLLLLIKSFCVLK